ncbi:MAG: alpha/beta hydrolase [Winogradskyella sp.]
MNRVLTHVYLMPGMAANPTIFEYIKLPEDKYKIHWLEWFLPKKNESLTSYAKRMNEEIKHDNVVLLGVSFGGILAQEMRKYKDFKKIIVVSSIKSHHELPKRMKLAKYTKIYKILPTHLVKNVETLAKYAFGETMKKRIDNYRRYLYVSDKHYLDWSIKQIVCWDQEEPMDDVIYIHGDKDTVFPNSCTNGTIVVKGGTHAMIITKYHWFNENLPNIIES